MFSCIQGGESRSLGMSKRSNHVFFQFIALFIHVCCTLTCTECYFTLCRTLVGNILLVNTLETNMFLGAMWVDKQWGWPRRKWREGILLLGSKFGPSLWTSEYYKDWSDAIKRTHGHSPDTPLSVFILLYAKLDRELGLRRGGRICIARVSHVGDWKFG